MAESSSTHTARAHHRPARRARAACSGLVAAAMVFAVVAYGASISAATPAGQTTLIPTGLSGPQGVGVDGSGDVYVADSANGRITELLTNGTETILPFTGLAGPVGVAADTAGDVFVANSGNGHIVELPKGGTQTTLGFSGLSNPNGVAVDAAGDVFVADSNNNRIVELPAGGSQVTLGFTGLSAPWGVAVDAAGDVFTTDAVNNRVVELPKTGAQVTLAITGLSSPSGIAVDTLGDVFVSDTLHNKVIKLPASGTAAAVAGITGLSNPQGIAVDPSGNLFVADYTHARVLEYSHLNVLSTANFFGLSNPWGVTADTAGDLFVADSLHSRIVELVPGGNPVVVPKLSGLSDPLDVAVDAAGDLFVADFANSRVVELPKGGSLTTLSLPDLFSPSGVGVDSAGDVFVSDFGNSQVLELPKGGSETILPFSGLSSPEGIAVDTAGDVFVADYGNSRIVELSNAGVQSTVAFSGLSFPRGVAVDSSGNVYAADTNNQRVVELSAGGSQSTLALTGVNSPNGVYVDNAGNAFVTDASVGLVELPAAPGGPTIPNLAKTTAYQTALTVAAPGVLTGATGTGLTVTSNTAPAHGTVTVAANGSFTYTPANGFAGVDTFNVTATDSSSRTATATVSITVSPPAAPTVPNLSKTTAYQTTLSVVAPGVLSGATGVGDTITANTTPSHGTVTVSSNGSFTYTPATGYAGADSFKVTATDSFGQTGTGTVSITVSPPAAPTVPNLSQSTAFQTALSVPAPGVLTGSTGVGDTVTGNTTPSHGTVTVSANGAFVYTPATAFSGTDSFRVTVTDGFAQTATATVTITVGLPGGPTVPNLSKTTAYQTVLTVAAPGVLAGSTGVGDTVTGNTTPSHGTVSVAADGSFTYTPANGFAGTDSFNVTVSDSFAQTTTATVTITVSLPSAPTVPNLSQSTSYQTPLVVAAPGVLAGATGVGLTVTGNTAPSHGTVAASPNGSFTYTPATGFAGTDSFTVTATDSFSRTATATVTITVALPPAPTVSNLSQTTAFQTALTVAAPGVLAGSTGVGDTVTANTTPSHGTVTVAANGSFTYTPAAGFAGADSFGFTATDQFGQAASATVSVTVGLPPAPTVPNLSQSTAYQTALTVAAPGILAGATGVGDTVTGNSSPGHGTVSVSTNGSFVYTPASGFTGTDSFTATVTDAFARTATATVTVSVGLPAGPTVPNLAETTTFQTPLTVPAPGVLAGSTGVGDTVTGNTNPSHGTVTVAANGSFTYSPALLYAGADSFTVTVSDAFGQTATATVSISVGLPLGPSVPNLAETTAYQTVLTVAAPGVLAGATGVGDTVTGHTSPAHGTLSIAANGSFTYTPASGFAGADSFTVTVSDLFARTASATVSITVALPAPPTVPNLAQTTGYQTALTVAAPGVLAGSTGVGDTATGHTNPSHGTVSVGTDGSFTYTPASGFAGTDSFTVTVTDAFGQTAVATVSVTVGLPPAPTVPNLSETTGYQTPLSVTAPGVLAGSTGVGDTVTGNTNPSHGTVTVAANGSFTYTPATGFAGSDSFGVTVTDAFSRTATATVTVTVGLPPAPTLANLAQSTPYQTALVVAAPGVLAGSTGVGDSITGSSTPSHGTVSVAANGSFTYTPATGFAGTDSFTVTATDAFSRTATATVTVTVGLPAAPTMTNLSETAAFQTPLAVMAPGVLAGATGVGITITSNTAPGHGTVSVAANGSFTYTPATGYTGTDSFTVTVTDAFGRTATSTVSITVATTGAGVTGLVTDQVTGLPVASVSVRVWVPGASNFLVAGVTNSAGQYTISGLAPGTYQIQFANGSYVTGWYPQATKQGPTVTLVAGQTFVANEQILSKTASTLTGVVHDAVSGVALSGATVSVFAAGASSALATTTTSSTGSWSLLVSGAGNFQVRFDATGYVTAWYLNSATQATSTTLAVANTQTVTVTQSLSPGSTTASVSGVVTDALSGSPIAGASVQVWLSGGTSPTATTTTDSVGHFSVPGLAPATYQLQYSAATYTTVWYPSSTTRGPTVTLTGGEALVANQALLSANAVTLHGVVTDASTSAVLAGVTVSVFPMNSTTAAAVVQTAADGSWSASLATPGLYQVRFDDTGYVSAWYGGASSQAASTTVSTTAGQSVLVSQSLAKSVVTTGSITGTVTDAVTGLPIAGVNCRVWLPGGSNYLVATVTDAGGHFTVANLAPGSYQVQFASGSYTTYWYGGSASKGATLTLASGQTLVTNAQLVSKTASTLTGVVHDSASGAALAGATVSVFTAGSSTALATTTTSATGAWTLLVAGAGNYQVRFDATGYVTAWYLNAATQTTATTLAVTNAQTVTVTQSLAQGTTTSSISGVVTDSLSGSPVAGVSVQVWTPTGTSALATTSTDSSGRYAFSGLAPGTYQLQYSAASYTTVWYPGSTTRGPTVTLAGGQSLLANEALLSANVATLDGVVHDAGTGAALAGATVSIFPVGSTTAASVVQTASDGSWSTLVSAGSYQVRFDATGYVTSWYANAATQAASTTVVGGAGQTVVVTQTLHAVVVTTASISGTVTDSATGLPVASVSVRVWVPGATNFLVAASTDASGHYLIANLTPGSYELQFANGSYTTQWYGGNASKGPPFTLASGQAMVVNQALVHK